MRQTREIVLDKTKSKNSPDAIRMYIKDISKKKLLTRSQEVELAIQISNTWQQ